MSDCKAILFRSRTTICITGSRPIFKRCAHAAMLDILTMAVWLSVTLTASTYPFNISPFLRITSGFAPRGGPHSAVTAKSPFVKISCSLLIGFSFISYDPLLPVFSGRLKGLFASFWGEHRSLNCLFDPIS